MTTVPTYHGAPTLPTVQRTEVDGVPTFWAPAAGPLTAALMFRVGSSDEVLARSGITHLVEHLAMHQLRQHRYQMNAFVDHRRTVFHCRGSAQEITGFLQGISAALVSLPLERAEHERNVLEAESARRSTSLADSLAMMRYGATGLGMSVYREFGLLWLTAEHLKAWSERYFTRHNAALWISGPIPKETRLTLHDGARVNENPPSPVAGPLPAWFNGPDGVVGLSMVGERTEALPAASAVLDHRLKERIRHTLALSYTPACGYLPISSTQAQIVAAADGLAENSERVRDEIIGVLDELAAGGPTEHELDDYERDIERSMLEPAAVLGMLDSAASAELTGDEWLGHAAHWERMRALTPRDVGDALAAARATAIVSVPQGLTGPEGFAPADTWSTTRVDGHAFKSAPIPGEREADRRRLTVGETGASVIYEHGAITTHFHRCVALLRYQDGGCTIIDTDGFRLTVRSSEWRKGAEAIATIERSIPPELHVPMPADAQSPSAARVGAAPPGQRSRLKKIGWWTWVGFSVLMSLVMFMRPSVARSEIPAGIRVPVSAAGTIDCGSEMSLTVAFSSAKPPVQGKGFALVAERCADSARQMVFGSTLGMISAVTASVVGIRARRRARR